jgi:D-glycero-D-manno-heptose 1,7-bisphosphate phosphatase
VDQHWKARLFGLIFDLILKEKFSEMQKYILLDRDGVINEESSVFIKSPDEFLPLENSLEAIALLNQHHYKIVIITNQSGLARGFFNETTLNLIHQKMRDELVKVGGEIEAIYFCPHQASDLCECRKPKGGLLKQFAADYDADLSQIYFIGDSLRDIQAAQNAGAIPVLVKTGNGSKTLQENPQLLTSILIFENLYDTAKHLALG